jgi:energy-converting hydrogenase Eha subunit C
MKIIAIILIVFGTLGLLMSLMMYGDIGIAAAFGAITAILSGIGFLQVNKKLSKVGE